MSLKKLEGQALTDFRYKMYQKKFMNKKETEAFMNLGYSRCRRAWEIMMSDADKTGLERLDNNIITTERVMQYMGISPKELERAYERNL